MKTASIPALRVEPKLRKAAERVLRDGETLSSFAEDAIRRELQDRVQQARFLERGLASGLKARQTGDYVPASFVLERLERRLLEVRAPSPRKRRKR